MAGIGGARRESQGGDFTKKVGLFEGKVIAINPTIEEYKDTLGIELKEESKAIEYVGESENGNATIRINVWLKDVKSEQNFNVTFFLEDKIRENKDGNKTQFINSYATLCWAESEEGLPDWFLRTRGVENVIKKAHPGEEDLYEFLKMWLPINFDAEDGELYLEWKKLIRGNLKELREQINGNLCQNVLCLATVMSTEKEGEIKEYQGVYNRAFLPPTYMKNFRNVDYTDSKIVENLKARKPKDLKFHEKFVAKITGEYGCRHFFILKELRDYNPDDNLVASNKVLDVDSSDY